MKTKVYEDMIAEVKENQKVSSLAYSSDIFLAVTNFCKKIAFPPNPLVENFIGRLAVLAPYL